LRHGQRHGKRRVVVAVPFLTITEQNTAVYRRLLDDDGDAEPVVLEHHSGVDFDVAVRRWGRLAAENWDAPFIVTTFVRLFESLYARKPAAMRRLHRLAIRSSSRLSRSARRVPDFPGASPQAPEWALAIGGWSVTLRRMTSRKLAFADAIRLLGGEPDELGRLNRLAGVAAAGITVTTVGAVDLFALRDELVKWGNASVGRIRERTRGLGRSDRTQRPGGHRDIRCVPSERRWRKLSR
jgi:hypothetical protein